MGNENKFWVAIWITLGITLLGFSKIMSTHYQHYNGTILETISKGIEPISIKCALEDYKDNNPTCIILSLKEK